MTGNPWSPKFDDSISARGNNSGFVVAVVNRMDLEIMSLDGVQWLTGWSTVCIYWPTPSGRDQMNKSLLLADEAAITNSFWKPAKQKDSDQMLCGLKWSAVRMTSPVTLGCCRRRPSASPASRAGVYQNYRIWRCKLFPLFRLEINKHF